MERYDAIIVGGGPAGSSCAWQLGRYGLKALVVDKESFPRTKPCAGWITPQVVECLRLDVAEYQQTRTWQPITGFCCGTIGGKSVDVCYGRPISFGIRRCEFDHYLLERSAADTRLGEPVDHIEFEDGRWVVDSRYCAPMLVGAGGHRCPVARRLGARHSKASVVVAREVEFPVPESACRNVDPEMPQLFFCDDREGYGWCLRKETHLNIGLGRTDHKGLPKHVDEFVAFLKERNQLKCELPDRWLGHAYQLYERQQPKLVDDGVLLIGDAAGLAYATSGEGIRPAVESGLVAAKVIAQVNSYEAESLTLYETELKRRLGEPKMRELADWLPAGLLGYVSPHLLASRWFCKQILLNRWFLHQGQPAMVL